jgi:hypothetical protein
MIWYEILGYFGSVLIGASMLMNNIWKLRWLNMSGAILFAIYGVVIGSLPVIILNLFNTTVNIFFLHQISRKKDFFTLLPLLKMRTLFLENFLNYYKKDMSKFFPDFDPATITENNGFIILRNVVPVGLFIFEEKLDGIIEIKLDYIIPDYRDFKNASFTLSSQAELLKERGFKTFTTTSIIGSHRKYLKKIGFTPSADNPHSFRKEI